MGKKSGVTWCDSSINPTENCRGCELWIRENGIRRCYAGKFHERYRGVFGTGIVEKPGRMVACRKWKDLSGTDRPEKPWLNGLPRIVFISDMSEAILADFSYLEQEVIPVVRETPHLYLWPTKQPARMVAFAEQLESRGGWPANLVPGVSITYDYTGQRLTTLAGYKHWPLKPFVSYEPAMEMVSRLALEIEKFGFVAIGGESGRSDYGISLDVARWCRGLCADVGAAFFMKQRGGIEKREGMDEFPEDLRIRQYPREWYADPRRAPAPSALSDRAVIEDTAITCSGCGEYHSVYLPCFGGPSGEDDHDTK